ncbi:MAG: DUF2523 domain-containing protein [Mitsuaria chitosanitabida]|jgi:hypothetical protein|uniref:DUF2523 domain-containing protein n=1 Tax=Roseateles chitosanitabidus TaxID=65048 RepID=UPI001B10C4E6|nr:DUF2523 domain-containing protein [Roseateles chitosanitabidus]MBO9687639.1 DUF2523 domain-containing protein [Roseateles chitosanitabidus]
MPIFIAALIGALVQAAGSLVGRVLISLGISYVVFSGVDTSIGWARDFAVSSFQGLDGNTLRVLGLMKVGVCISMLSSAVVARLTLKGLTGGLLKRLAVK